MDGVEASRLYSAVSDKWRGSESYSRGWPASWSPDEWKSRGGVRRRLWAWACLESSSVQILVIIANTPARLWKTDVEKGFVWMLHTSQSILSPNRDPMQMRCLNIMIEDAKTHWAKGNPVPIPKLGSRIAYYSGPRKSVRWNNPKWPGDAVRKFGKSFLFCISIRVPWKPLAGR